MLQGNMCVKNDIFVQILQHRKQKQEALPQQKKSISVENSHLRVGRTASVLRRNPTYKTLTLKRTSPCLTKKPCLKRLKVPTQISSKWWTLKNHRSTDVMRMCSSQLQLYINKSKCQNLFPQLIHLWLVIYGWSLHFCVVFCKFLYFLHLPFSWSYQFWFFFSSQHVTFVIAYFNRFRFSGSKYFLRMEKKVIWGSREFRV